MRAFIVAAWAERKVNSERRRRIGFMGRKVPKGALMRKARGAIG
jgi:hypothetical protein